MHARRHPARPAMPCHPPLPPSGSLPILRIPLGLALANTCSRQTPFAAPWMQPDAGRWSVGSVPAVTKLIYDNSPLTMTTRQQTAACFPTSEHRYRDTSSNLLLLLILPAHLLLEYLLSCPASLLAFLCTTTHSCALASTSRSLLESPPLAQSRSAPASFTDFPMTAAPAPVDTFRTIVSPLRCKFAMSNRAPMSYATCARLVSADEYRSAGSLDVRRQIQCLLTFVSAACLSAEHRAWTVRSRI